MKAVFKVPKDMKSRIEEAVKKDEEINRGSILFRDGSAIGEDPECYYLVYDGTEESIRKISDMGIERDGNEERILQKVEEEEARAIEGFGKLVF